MQSLMDSDKPMFMSATFSSLTRPGWAPVLFLCSVIAILSLQLTSKSTLVPGSPGIQPAINRPADGKRSCSGFFRGSAERGLVMSIRDFGGVGDGKTLNTDAFQRAVRFMEGFGASGGSRLNVPTGTWLTGSFNLTSNFTLFLEEGAVILGSKNGTGEIFPIAKALFLDFSSRAGHLASHGFLADAEGMLTTGLTVSYGGCDKVVVLYSFNGPTVGYTLYSQYAQAFTLHTFDPEDWPIIQPLPSYGRGRERPGGRHISLVHGDGLVNVVITGNNGTIDGQGKMWWELWWNRTLEHTRGHLVEIKNSHNVLISNLTFRNSPFWTIHPVYCSNVVIKDMTILAPLTAPNTDGIDPDSSTNVCIEDCYIESGDDLVAVKSGWDHYGISMARPSSNITIRRISGTTPTCSGIGIGSEMSGGISNVTIEDLHVWDSAAGVRVKTDVGRGGYISNITIKNIFMDRVKVPIRFSRGSNDHPDEGWDQNALPTVKGIFVSDIFSVNSTKAPVLEGMEGAIFEGICMRNVTMLGIHPNLKWQCEFVSGSADRVIPAPCMEMQQQNGSSLCP